MCQLLSGGPWVRQILNLTGVVPLHPATLSHEQVLRAPPGALQAVLCADAPLGAPVLDSHGPTKQSHPASKAVTSESAQQFPRVQTASSVLQ